MPRGWVADLVNVGNKGDALKLLHDVITAKRHHRQWQNTYESIMYMYLDLCVELKEHRYADPRCLSSIDSVFPYLDKLV